MLYDDEKRLVLQSLDGLIRNTGWDSQLATSLCDWMVAHRSYLGVDITPFLAGTGYNQTKPKNKADWKSLAGHIKARSPGGERSSASREEV